MYVCMYVCMIAAMLHDMGRDGMNNTFHKNAMTRRCVCMYNTYVCVCMCDVIA